MNNEAHQEAGALTRVERKLGKEWKEAGMDLGILNINRIC